MYYLLITHTLTNLLFGNPKQQNKPTINSNSRLFLSLYSISLSLGKKQIIGKPWEIFDWFGFFMRHSYNIGLFQSIHHNIPFAFHRGILWLLCLIEFCIWNVDELIDSYIHRNINDTPT